MTPEEHKRVSLEIGKASSFAAVNLEAEAARHVIAALGLVQDMLAAGQNVPERLQWLREDTRTAARRA